MCRFGERRRVGNCAASLGNKVNEERYEAICFDFDGVLADTEPLHCAAWAEALAPLGIHLDWETFRRNCIGIPDRQAAEFFRTLAVPPASFDAVWSLKARKNEAFTRMMEASPPFVEGLDSFLNSLAGYRLAIVTASNRCEIEHALQVGHIWPHFEALVCAEDVSEPKPSAEPYLRAAAMLGIRKALAVEDSEVGVQSALAAGFDVVRVSSVADTMPTVQSRLRRFR